MFVFSPLMERLYRTGEASRLLGVHPMTLRRWIKSGKVKAKRTIGGEYRIPEGEVRRLLGEKPPIIRAVIYARVSSSDQKSDLERQVEYLRNYCSARGYKVTGILRDVAGGLNEKRRVVESVKQAIRDC